MNRNHSSANLPHAKRMGTESSDIAAESWATITPSDLVRSVSRRLPSVLVTAVIVTLIVAAILLAWPNQYSSDGMFYVRLGRGAVSMDPTTEPTRSVSLMESRSSEVKSISQMLNSREIADRVVRAVGAREINYPRNWIEKIVHNTTSWSSSKSENDDRIAYEQQIAHEEAVKRVMKSVTIAAPKDSYTLSVAAKGSDPLLTQKLVQAIMDEYGAYHVEAHRSNGSFGFFDEQTKASEVAALEARKSLQVARKEMGWMSTQSAEKSLRDRITELNLALDLAKSKLAESLSQTKVLGQRLETIEEWVPMEVTSVANAAADGMRTELLNSQLLDGEKLSKVTPNHPRYKILKNKMKSGVQMVESVGSDRQEQKEALNPVYIKLQTEYQAALARSAGSVSLVESLDSSLSEATTDLQRLNEDAVKLAQLNWTVDITEKTYLNHAKSLESARMTNELDKQNMSDVSIIQNASLNLKKIGPPRLALMMIGSLLGLCLGALQALVRDNPVSIASLNHSGASQPGPEPTLQPTGGNLAPEEFLLPSDAPEPVDSVTKTKEWVSIPR